MAAGLPEARRVAYGIVLGQAALTAALAVLCAVFGGSRMAASAAAGGGIGTAASLALAVFAFRSRDQDARSVLRAFIVGEAVKLGVVVCLFVVVFTTMKQVLVPAALFGAYVATFFVHWAALGRAQPTSEGRGLDRHG